MSEWKEVRLGDFIEFNPNRRIKKGEIAKKITMDMLIPHSKQIYKFTKEPYNGGTKFQNGDTIMARITPCLENGKHAYINFLGNKEIAYGSTEYIVLCGKPKITDNEFVYYLSHSPIFKNTAIKSMVGSSGRQRAQTDVLMDLYVNVPTNISEQKEIADILSSLDAKIETNNKLNEKLEEMAQAIFKSWFVDFEPFKNQPFHETEIGMIPEGWEVTTFSSIIENLISGDWGKESETGNYVHKVACVRGCDFEDIKNGLRGKTPERFILDKNFESKRPKHNDIIVEMSGGTATVSTGRVCYITKELLDQYEGNIVCTNFCKIVRPVNGWSQFLYYYWQYKYDKKVMFCYENGTSGIKNFSINDFIGMEPICIPQKDSLDSFNSIIDKIRKKIQNNGIESQRLASLRDTLLPRLMSGEIKI